MATPNKPPNHAQMASAHVGWVTGLVRDPTHARLRQGRAASRKLKAPMVGDPPVDAIPRKLVVRLEQGDSFGEARKLVQRHPGDKVAVLNMANAGRAGGGFRNGGRAQEEDLCHCSTLYAHLHQPLYPLANDELIYSPDVLVMKEKAASGASGNPWTLLPQNDWYYVDVITCAALSNPPIDWVAADDGDGQIDRYRSPSDRNMMKNKIVHILSSAVQQGAKRVVLAPFGCGMFANPVREVALLMKSILVNDNTHRGPLHDWGTLGLEEVVIAVYDRVSRQPVWNGFMNVFRDDALSYGQGQTARPHLIQYTGFAAGYEGAAYEAPDDSLMDDSLFN